MGVRVAMAQSYVEPIQTKTLIDGFYVVQKTLKAEKNRAYVEGYIEGKIDQTRYIFSLIETNR